MADDASGDGDDGQRDSPPNPDVQNSKTGRGHTDEWESTEPSVDVDRDDRLERDPRSNRDGYGERSDGGDEYRIPMDLSSESGGTETSETDDVDAEEDDPYAPEPSSTPIEPGDPNLENVFFVFLGAIAMGLVLFRILLIPF